MFLDFSFCRLRKADVGLCETSVTELLDARTRCNLSPLPFFVEAASQSTGMKGRGGWYYPPLASLPITVHPPKGREDHSYLRETTSRAAIENASRKKNQPFEFEL
ncbi:hypothetical protein EYR41_001029 [Orbilia oligospora]|uniref:Uncharacterized protein n=1 Tax=Orbilia oligospora TaxID=2813651 RepID=A0A7C8PN03_ORBOL|nr:hypothetical protein TWF751_004499 [Orbilia oligospora]TGJ73970.1 hypothetical protein EYR41_001029 [Orbilia oligospora]